MGGWGSGGHNKTHRQVEKQRLLRVDSFAVYDNLRYDKYICYKDKVDIRGGCTIIRYYPHSKEAEILENGAYYPLGLSRVTNIDGYTQRLYFLCPCCDRRVRYLYRNRNGFYMCRKCAGLNYRSQQVSGMASLGFSRAFLISAAASLVIVVAILGLYCYDCRKNSRKRNYKTNSI